MGYLSRIEALLEALLNGTEPPVTTPQSRVEAHLHAMINGDEITDDAKSRIEECLRGMMTDTVPQEKPKSRIEACIHAIITGSNPPEEPKSRSEVYLHAIWDKYHNGSEEPEEPTTPTIIWSKTPEYAVLWETGEVVAGDQYVSEMFALENGYVYELKQPTGGSWMGIAVYDANGTFRYHIGNSRDGDLYLDGFDIGYIRIHVYPNSPDELDLSTVVPVNTGRIWSVNKYFIDSSTGVITLNERNNYITLQKIPVEAGATYKLSTSGTHQYLAWYEYTEGGTYLCSHGNARDPKELEATVSRGTAYVILSMHGGEGNCDDYATFVKTADAVDDEITDYPTGLVYELAEPTTFNGTSDYIDTGVRLYEADKDFEIMIAFKEDATYNEVNATILHCMLESNPWPGLSLHHVSGYFPTLIVVGSSRRDTSIPDINATRLVITKLGLIYRVQIMHAGLTEPQLLSEFTIASTGIDNSLLIGAYQDTSGNKGRFWNGTISQCKVYVDDLPSDEETNAFLMSEEEPSGIVWSETAEYNIDSTTGETVSGNAYVSEPFCVESGYVYELATPVGGSWNTIFVYDLNGNFKYFKCNPSSTGGKGTLYFDGFENQLIRLSVCKESDEFDLSTVVPVKTDRIWSVERYKTNSTNGNIYLDGNGDYFTLQKIPVEGGATYKFSTTGTHKYLKWFEYSGQGNYLGYKGGIDQWLTELEAPVSDNTTHVILCAYTGETPVDDYVTFVKTADAPQEPDVPEEPINVTWLTGRWDANKNDGTFTPSSARSTELITEKIPVEGGATYLFSTTGNHNWLKMFKYVNDIYAGYDGDVSGAKTLEVTVSPNTTHVVLAMAQGEDNAGSYATFIKTADAPEEPITPTIVWSETPTYNIDNSGEVTSGDVYVSNMFELEDGVVYAIKRPNNGSWARFAKYDSNGTFLYREEHESRTLYVEGYDGAKIRLGIYPNNNAFDLSTFKPEPIDRLWSVTSKYIADLNTGVISNSTTNVDYITVRKIPVIGGNTYRFSSSGNYYYKKIYAYKEDGTFLGYFGNAENFDAVEATLSEDTAYVMLSAWHSNTTLDSDDIMNFSVVSTEEPTGLVYELAEPMTFNGSSDFIDTDVKLYDKDKNFEILMEFEKGEIINESATLLHCMYEGGSPYQGLTIKHNTQTTAKHLLLTAVGTNQVQNNVPTNGVTRIALVKIGDYFATKVMHEGIAEPQLVTEGTIGYKQYDGNLLIGAYQDNNGNKGRFWNGTISKCKVYVGADLPSDEETTAFLMGD